MRKSREEAAATRRRIVETASREFRKNGIAETGLKDLMLSAGLTTQGGFYKHFESKDQLIGEAVEFGFAQLLLGVEDSIESARPGEGYAAIVTHYLSPKHRADVANACPFSSLGTELRRCDDSTAEVTADALRTLISLVAEQIQNVSRQQAQQKATAAVAAMVGAMVLSRIAKGTKRPNAILAETRDFLLQA